MRTGLRAATNVLKALLLLGGFAGLVTALGWALGGLGVAALFALAGLLMAATAWWYGPRILLASLGARELSLAESPALHTTTERVAGAAGLARPRLYLLADGHPRALAVGRGGSAPFLAVSQGLLGALPPAELEGVLAHELARGRHRDVAVETPVVLVAGWLVEASRIGGFLERALLFVLGPVAASVVHVLLSPRRVFAADALAAAACGTPHGLADALVRLEQAQEMVSFQASPVTEPLYVVNPFSEDGIAALFDTHPPIGARGARLRALDPEWRERLLADEG